MLPRYRFEPKFDRPGHVVYEESPDYTNAAICLGLGVGFLAVGFLGLSFFAVDIAYRKALGSCVFGGFVSCALAATYFVKSTITLDRESASVAIQRRLIGLRWTMQYRMEEIEQFFEAAASEKEKRLLAVEFKNGRTRKVTLWAVRTSLSAEEARFNSLLTDFRQEFAKKTGQVHVEMTDDQRWSLTLENARIDLRKHVWRTLYSALGLLVAVAILTPFLYGRPLHAYWYTLGTFVLFLCLGLLIYLVLEAAASLIDWSYVRDLDKIDKQYPAA